MATKTFYGYTNLEVTNGVQGIVDDIVNEVSGLEILENENEVVEAYKSDKAKFTFTSFQELEPKIRITKFTITVEDLGPISERLNDQTDSGSSEAAPDEESGGQVSGEGGND